MRVLTRYEKEKKPLCISKQLERKEVIFYANTNKNRVPRTRTR